MNAQENARGPGPKDLTVRDLFAMTAMIALMSSEPWVRMMNDHAAKSDVQFKTALAQNSWEMADAMLATRGQGGAA